MTIALDVPSQPSTVNVSHAVGGTYAAPPATCPDDGLIEFLRARPRLFSVAYRMLGRVPEAEEIVQDVWVRWQTTDRSRVRNPPAFLVTATARLAINLLHSARARRETCAASSLPERVDSRADPGLRAERGEALNLAALLLLQKLLPTERAAFVLREAFSYPYREIAAILRVAEANARQLVTRARSHLLGGRRAPVRPAQQRRLLDALLAAARMGDLARLEGFFAADVVSTSENCCPLRACQSFIASASPGSRCHKSVRRPVIAVDGRKHREGDIDHEIRHHRGHRTHRIEARGEAARPRR